MKKIGIVMDMLVCLLAGIVAGIGFLFNVVLGLFLFIFVVLFHISRSYFYNELRKIKQGGRE